MERIPNIVARAAVDAADATDNVVFQALECRGDSINVVFSTDEPEDSETLWHVDVTLSRTLLRLGFDAAEMASAQLRQAVIELLRKRRVATGGGREGMVTP